MFNCIDLNKNTISFLECTLFTTTETVSLTKRHHETERTTEWKNNFLLFFFLFFAPLPYKKNIFTVISPLDVSPLLAIDINFEFLRRFFFFKKWVIKIHV